MSEWAVILGVSSGTGAAIARELRRATALRIFGMHRGRYQESADALRHELLEAAAGSDGRDAGPVFLKGDAATPEGAARGADALLAAAGPRSVRLFVHSIASASVGHFVVGDGPGFHPRQVQKTFDAMAHSFVYWAQALVERDLLAPGARLLALTNPLKWTLLANAGLITAAKAALEIYVRHLAVELGPLGYRVNMLLFGTVLTPAVRHVYSEQALARLEQKHAAMNPSGRMCQVEDVARIVPLLLRDELDWFNGATIDFSGGMLLQVLDLLLNREEALR